MTRVRALSLLLPIAAAALLTSGTGTSSAAGPMLGFTINESLTNGSIELGTPNGERVCTGEGDALTCTQPMGISTSYRFNVSITETGTGAPGRMIGGCTVMYAGTTTTYANRNGTQNATGSEDCDLHFVFGADEAWAGMHEGRVLVDAMETDTFTFTMTRGTGKFAGLSGSWSMSAPNPWEVPGPIGSKGEPIPTVAFHAMRAVAQAGTAIHPRADGDASIGIPLSTAPHADVTSLGLLAPTNAAAKAEVAAAAGSTCKGTMTAGKKVIALPAKKVPANSGFVVLKSFPSGALKGVAAWKLHVTCTLKGKSIVVDRALTTFAVVPNAPV